MHQPAWGERLAHAGHLAARRETLTPTRRALVDDRLHGRVVEQAAEDVERGKPDPEPYLTAMVRLHPRAPGLRPQDCVVIEDTMPGIASALAAGMKVVAVAQTYSADKLRAAHLVVDSVAALDADGLRRRFG